MKAPIAALLILLLAGLALAAPAAPPPPAPLLLTGARVLDPSGDRLLDGRDVLIENGRIAAIGAAGILQAPAGTQKIDLTGLTLIPGLIEMHSHLLLHPYDETPWDDQVLKEPLELRTIRAVTAARATLEAGFTTVRDLGTEGAAFADVSLRDAIAQGMIPGPRVFAATRAIVATGCYGPSGFDPRWEVPKGAQEVTGPVEMRKAVREQIAAGADWIKVYADYRRRPGITTPTFTEEEMAAAVDEARSAGLPVAAHAYTEEGIRRAVLAGVRTIEHGTYVTDELLALMKQKGVALIPTLAASEAVSRYAGWKPGTPEPQRIKETREMFARALKSGVTIANGSDVGVFAHGKNARELELMVAYGMTPGQALKAATITAAAVLGREKDLGRIAPGYLADLVAVKGDPLAEISTIERPVVVVKEGRVAVGPP
ncbi:MAG TPA: amidohydrolase family protein [Thermoanaerobaculia bacterium]|nr:amidohydrolase family protein [Thermoanaerobaculia bacterium]